MLSPPAQAAASARQGSSLDQLYNIMQSHENKLGGGEGVEGIYGSITKKGTQRIFSSFQHNCRFGPNSILVDIGAGLGRPLLHALYSPGIKGSFGIELDHVKVHKATSFLKSTVTEMGRRGLAPPSSSAPPPLPEIKCCRVEEVPTLEPATHAYSFWEGIPSEGRAAFGRLFAASRTLHGIAVVQRAMRGGDPARLMLELGFGPLMLVSNFAVAMSGSGASFQAYVFSKVSARSAGLLLSGAMPRSPPATVGASPQAAAAAVPAAVATGKPDKEGEEEMAVREVPDAVALPPLQRSSGAREASGAALPGKEAGRPGELAPGSSPAKRSREAAAPVGAAAGQGTGKGWWSTVGQEVATGATGGEGVEGHRHGLSAGEAPSGSEFGPKRSARLRAKKAAGAEPKAVQRQAGQAVRRGMAAVHVPPLGSEEQEEEVQVVAVVEGRGKGGVQQQHKRKQREAAIGADVTAAAMAGSPGSGLSRGA